jgi:hypothetical protein
VKPAACTPAADVIEHGQMRHSLISRRLVSARRPGTRPAASAGGSSLETTSWAASHRTAAEVGVRDRPGARDTRWSL